MSRSLAPWLVSLVFGAGLITNAGCRKAPKQSTPAPSASVSASASAAPSVVSIPRKQRHPSPPYPIEAGKGVGPIRFGATVATVERLMMGKCDEVTQDVCRFYDAALEFELKDGVVQGINIYGPDRQVAPGSNKTWGYFLGGILPYEVKDAIPILRMGMVPGYIREKLGKPKQTTELDGKDFTRTKLRDDYPNMTLEYDYNPATQKLMLAHVHLSKPEKH